MIKKGLIILLLLLSGNVFSQSLDSINYWFDKYEYKKATDEFKKIPANHKLSREDYLRWSYASFASHDYEMCHNITDSLINTGKVPAFFYYAHGFSAMVLGQYEKANASYKTYKALDNEFFVDSLIASCEQISDWEPENFVSFIPFNENPTKANISGTYSNGSLFFFQEGGLDYQKNKVEDISLENAELLFMSPYKYSLSNNQFNTIALPDEYKNNNIVSLTLDSSKNEVYFTMSNPLSQDLSMKQPRIWVGKYDNDSITNIHLWEYAGAEDSSSTAFATISPDMQHLVFTKQFYNKSTSDLFISSKKGDTWSKPKLIKELSSKGDDAFPLFLNDSTLSFASNGRVGYGGFDIYLASFNDGEFNHIRHLKTPINSFSDDFNLYYSPKKDTVFFTSNRDKNLNDDNIYIVQLSEPEPEPEPIEEPIQLDDLYVYFDFDKSVVKPSEREKINSHNFDVLKDTEYSISLISYCDNRGTNAYNDILGEKRANAVQEVLLKYGIDEAKTTIISKGKRENLVDCVACTEEDHRKNRVVIIKVETIKESIN